MIFYLGAHHPNWLEHSPVPLFVSRRPLSPMKRLPRAASAWALDSGGFTELSMHGRWTISASDYAAEVRRFQDDVGRLAWAAPQDWMCEPTMLKRTGLTVEQHQRRTIDNYRELCAIAPDVQWTPVLQGWTIGDYERHVEAYGAAGIALECLPLVGVGTVCRRQNTLSASLLLGVLSGLYGLRLHGFGLKLTGLRAAAQYLQSADSMAWSLNARKNPPLPGHAHKSCANCIEYAMSWRADALDAIARAA